jgi:uncharacterized protein (TIGR02145 family)
MKKVIFLPFFLILVFSSCKKQGCTDSSANNYNSSANEDNGNCTYSLLDIEGNSYGAKSIGNQIWMTENLKVKKYRNGDTIPQVQDPIQWFYLTTGAWCYYENDPSKGILYNWYAVNDPRGLVPSGYHVPTDAEWTVLTDFLGGESVAGGKMKSTSGWPENGTNSSGFSGLPGGYRTTNGQFLVKGNMGYWWSSSEYVSGWAYYRQLEGSSGYVIRNDGMKGTGFSVRCVKD